MVAGTFDLIYFMVDFIKMKKNRVYPMIPVVSGRFTLGAQGTQGATEFDNIYVGKIVVQHSLKRSKSISK